MLTSSSFLELKNSKQKFLKIYFSVKENCLKMSEEKLVFAQNYIDGKFEECQDYLDSFNPVRNERSPLNDVAYMVCFILILTASKVWK